MAIMAKINMVLADITGVENVQETDDDDAMESFIRGKYHEVHVLIQYLKISNGIIDRIFLSL